ncbi:unnamed protein product, partial [Didymodactylos carnosus]
MDFAATDEGKKLELKTYTYIVTLTHSNQDEQTTLSAAQLALKAFHQDHPEITKMIKRSDNAGVLGGHSTAMAEVAAHEEIGIQLLKREYSEVQAGKAVCDRMAGVAKQRLRGWLNAGHDVLSASDLKLGFESYGGVKNLKVLVAEKDYKAKPLAKGSIPEVSSVRSIEYTDDGMLIRKASGIGKGKLVPYTSHMFSNNLTETETVERADKTSRPPVIVNVATSKRSDRQYNPIYFCQEQQCTSTFECETDLALHMAAGFHSNAGDNKKLSTYDQAKLQLYDRVQQQQLPQTTTQSMLSRNSPTKAADSPSSSTTCMKSPVHMQYFKESGWGLRVRQPPAHPTPQMKKFIQCACKEKSRGVGDRLTGEELHKKMRAARDIQGAKMFQPKDYLTPRQCENQLKPLYS